MENLNEFKNRTSYIHKQLPEHGGMQINPQASLKINKQGNFKNFYGDTTVFLLDNKTKKVLNQYQELLYNNNAEILGDKLPSDTFHITLHDLDNSTNLSEIHHKMILNRNLVINLFQELKSLDLTIHLKSTKVFSMLNTSIVLCFEPASDEDCFKIMELYEKFQSVVPLNYPLTPHVTLAYYRPIDLNELQVSKLQQVFDTINQLQSIEIELNIKDLVYQRFDSMAHYQTVEDVLWYS